jgi:hypothetical protein
MHNSSLVSVSIRHNRKITAAMLQSCRLRLSDQNVSISLRQATGKLMGTAADPAVIGAKPLSEGERIIDTFIAASKTFTDIRRNASWWVPWLLMAIFGLGMVFVVDKKLGMDTAYENQLRLQPKQMDKIDQMPPDQKANAIRIGTAITRYIAYGWPMMTIIFLAIIAAVLMATFNFGFGAEVKFRQAMAVSMYASLPSIIKVLIASVVVAVGAAEGFTFQNPVASNLSGLVDPSSSHFLYSVLASLDVFTIWTLVLTGIGYSCITRVKRGTCMGVVFGWWIVIVLVSSGFGALFA